MYSSQLIYKKGAQVITSCKGIKGDTGLKGEPGTNGVKGDSGGDKGEPGVDGTNGEPGVDGTDGTNGISGSRGNVAIVDSQYGNNSTASVGGLPFLTIQAALAVIQSGQQIYVLPGTYTVSAFTIPTNVVLQGNPPCIIQYTATASTTLITMGEYSRLDNFTINLTSSAHYDLIGILFPNTTCSTAEIMNVHLTVNNSSASVSGTSNVSGIVCNGTGGLLTTSFAWNAIQSSTLNILSNGGGNKRGILVSGPNVVSTRDTNVYVAPPTSTSNGSYVGIETNDASNTGSIQIRSSSIGVTPPTAGYVYSASDILQTTPATIASPAYLASPGIQVGPGTDLVSKTAGGKGFSTFSYPSVLVYGLKGDIHDGVSGYLWYGTQQVSNNNFPDPNTPAYFRIQQPSILSGLSCALTTAPGGANSITLLVKRTPYNGTIVNTVFTVTLSGTTREEYFYNGSVSLNAGDKLHVYLTYTGNQANLAHDLMVQLDLF